MPKYVNADKLLEKFQKKGSSDAWGGEYIRKVINEAPDVQPGEFDPDEWCHDCKEYDKEKHYCPRWSRIIRRTAEEMKAELPSTEAKPVKHGRWEYPYVGTAYKRCSVCGFTHNHIPTKSHYCCNCGARMDEVKND